jgi:hypothetical protein
MDELHHFFNSGTKQPVCNTPFQGDDTVGSQDLDAVTCIECLRRLAKDAGRYGNGRRPMRR